MNVMYTCDDNYVWLMGISMISLFENNKKSEISVYLLGDEISEEHKKILLDVAVRYHQKCVIIDVPKFPIPESLYSKRWPRSAFTRLYSGQFLPVDVDKILYLDCDTIIASSISELWELDAHGKIISGVKDCISRQYKKNIGLDPTETYINAGVLLIDVTQLRALDISQKIENFLEKYSKSMHYADQDVLNGVFNGDFGILEPEFNVMTLVCSFPYQDIITMRHPSNYYTRQAIERAAGNPRIIHYTTCMGIVRPWMEQSNHKYKDLFLRYKELSPWKERPLSPLQNSGLKDRLKTLIVCSPALLRNHTIGVVHAYLFPHYLNIRAKIKQ